MSEAKEAIEQPHSCKISINAKGQYSGEVKVYADNSATARVLATNQAALLEALIKSKNSPPKPGAV